MTQIDNKSQKNVPGPVPVLYSLGHFVPPQVIYLQSKKYVFLTQKRRC